MFGGKYLNNWRMAELHAKEAPDRVRELERWGGVFDRTPDGRMSQRAFGGHTYRRLVHIGDRTGLELIRTLQDQGVHQGIDVFMECTITRLLEDGDRVCGAFGYWRATGQFVVFKAKAVVLATGGLGKGWRITSNSWEYTGDGHALGYEAGAELVDMEFVQFHPTGMVWPPGVVGLLVTEAVRGEGGILRNGEGERFMERYDPKRMELSTRDVVARAIYTEVKEGRGTPRGGVFLDVSHLPAALGEEAAAEHVRAVHGARRRRHHPRADGGRADLPLRDGRDQGRRGHGCEPRARPVRHGRVLGRHARREPPRRQLALRPARLRQADGRGSGAPRQGGRAASASTRRQVSDAAARDARLPRRPGRGSLPAADGPAGRRCTRTSASSASESGLSRALVALEELRRRAADVRIASGGREYNPGWHLCRELQALMLVTEAVTRAALLREESRGAHSRLDFPATSDDWGDHNVVVAKSEDGTMHVERRDVVKVAELEPLVAARKAAERA